MTTTTVTISHRHRVTFSAAHHDETVAPELPEGRNHGHLYEVEIVSATDEHWAKIDAWVKQYADHQNLDQAFTFATTPARIAAYLLTVFEQFDPTISLIQIRLDRSGDAVIVEAS